MFVYRGFPVGLSSLGLKNKVAESSNIDQFSTEFYTLLDTCFDEWYCPRQNWMAGRDLWADRK